MPKATAKHTARVVAKVIRADGTEETFVCEDVSVTNIAAVRDALAGSQVGESEEDIARRAKEANDAESARNEAANRAATKAAKGDR